MNEHEEETADMNGRREIQPANEASLEIIELHQKKYHENLEPSEDYFS
jgi:hypothetical protein